MTTPVAEPIAPSRGRTFALWFALLGGVLAAFANEQIEYGLVAWSCGRLDPTLRVMLHVVPAVLLATAIAASLVGWHFWSDRAHDVEDDLPPQDRPGTTPREPRDAQDPRARALQITKRIRFMGLVGAGASALGALVILNMWLPVFYLSPCQFT